MASAGAKLKFTQQHVAGVSLANWGSSVLLMPRKESLPGQKDNKCLVGSLNWKLIKERMVVGVNLPESKLTINPGGIEICSGEQVTGEKQPQSMGHRHVNPL